MMKTLLLFSLSSTRAVRPRNSASASALSSSLHQLLLHDTSTSICTRHSYVHGHGHGHGHNAALLGLRWYRAAAPVRSYSASKGSSCRSSSNASNAVRDFTQSKGKITERDAVEFMNKNRGSMDARDATAFVHAVAKRKITLADNMMVTLIEILQQNQPMKVNLIYLTKCFQGLKCFRTKSNDCAIVESYLLYLQRAIQNNSSSIKLDGQSVGQCLFALQGISSKQRGLSSLLCTLAPKIHETNEMLSAQAIGNALYGLQGMSSGEAEVRGVLTALSRKIGESQEMLDAQEIGNALYGLQGMSSGEAEVRDVLMALSRKIGESQAMLNAQEIGNALYGLQGMSSGEAEVRDVLMALSRKIGESQAMLSGQEIGNALYGLQGMSSGEAEVRDVLMALSRKIGESQAMLDAQAIGNSLYGLFNILLFEVMDEVSVPLVERVSELMDVLLDGNTDGEISVFELRDMLRPLKLAMHFFGDKGIVLDQAQRIDRLQRLVESRGGDEAEENATQSFTEERFYRCIRSVLTSSRHHSPQYEVSHNEFLDSCFEADIIIRTVGGKDEPAVVYNIEIDGPSHLQPKKKRLCRYRDEYLKNACGIQIARIPLGERRLQGESDVQIEAMARRALKALNILDGESNEMEGQ